ncbi:uncharacterized protein LOC127811511 isoform X2 [Diospyros lotus]|uniref:uncharacterized protein LOC127811511 isoform X2 n=1 Tax=Diospyros lotus TaxID=55363 RepID=UPI00224EE094|nr:uncharacterized protein LOC127811511 isoform X2 [Diospyros lotus]
MPPRTKRLSLEDYLRFIDTHRQINFKLDLLNQVIAMHGFRKASHTTKKVLVEAVNSIDLMNPCRSTLDDENVSSCAFMTLEEAINDLNNLNWQECCVTSIQTLNSVNHDSSVLHQKDEISSSKSRKRPKLLAVRGDSSEAAHGGGNKTTPKTIEDTDLGASGRERGNLYMPG